MSLDFFLNGTRFSTQVVCRTWNIILAASNLFNSFFTNGSSEGCIFHNFWWKGFVSPFNGIMFWIIFLSYVFKSLYVHTNTSLNSLHNFMNASLSAYVQLIFLGFRFGLRFTASYSKDELLVLVLVGLLNLSWRSNSFSSLIMFLGIPLLCSSFPSKVESWRRDLCCSSSMTDPLNVHHLWIPSNS